MEDGTSPNGKYDVVLEADKDTPTYQKYEMKGEDVPRLLVREIASKKVISSLPFPSDLDSDQRPLRDHTKVIWRADSAALIINTHERFYSYTNILVLDPKNLRFRDLEFPDYKQLTGLEAPKAEDLTSRSHEYGREWSKEGLLVYEMLLHRSGTYNGDDPLHHRVFLRVGTDGMEVVRHEPITDQ